MHSAFVDVRWMSQVLKKRPDDLTMNDMRQLMLFVGMMDQATIGGANA